jgi:hypothetical protein
MPETLFQHAASCIPKANATHAPRSCGRRVKGPSFGVSELHSFWRKVDVFGDFRAVRGSVFFAVGGVGALANRCTGRKRHRPKLKPCLTETSVVRFATVRLALKPGPGSPTPCRAASKASRPSPASAGAPRGDGVRNASSASKQTFGYFAGTRGHARRALFRRS